MPDDLLSPAIFVSWLMTSFSNFSICRVILGIALSIQSESIIVSSMLQRDNEFSLTDLSRLE